MTSCPASDATAPGPVTYTIIVRGEVDEALPLGFPGLTVAQVEENTLITGVFPLRENLFELLRHLAEQGIEFLSASASPTEDDSISA